MTHYETLGLSTCADAIVIKAAYRALSQRHHPDKCAPNERDTAHRRMAAINAAFQVLGDAVSRQQYDEGLSKASPEKGSAFDPPGGPNTPLQRGVIRLRGRIAILFMTALLTFAVGVDKKPWWQWSLEFLTGGFEPPSHYVLHWPIIVTTLGVGLWLAARAGRRST
ncbi:J domain-containing protein [Methylibium sp.]|uniref:J domain-containing protein n=1 Tax=Methylibium sp. TaxID=2067992 RepID=UPI00286AE53C|nr:J domain-containing protein [Methylibium sp.]